MPSFSGISQAGDVAEALRAAVAAAARALNTNFFTWRLDHISGTVGGFVGAHDVSVTIDAKAPGPVAAAAIPVAKAQCGDWHAWHNRMPGSAPTLHVVGRCMFPTAGYRVELRPVVPQGINPAIYLLEKIVHAPAGPVPQVETEVAVHYSEQTSARYSEVHILPDNVVVAVREVS